MSTYTTDDFHDALFLLEFIEALFSYLPGYIEQPYSGKKGSSL
tara:strand:- start:11888 stop:12016 length:129 start_codon:yes stop_codon:yes gene_type:complete